jgi:hypothetical protein
VLAIALPMILSVLTTVMSLGVVSLPRGVVMILYRSHVHGSLDENLVSNYKIDDFNNSSRFSSLEMSSRRSIFILCQSTIYRTPTSGGQVSNLCKVYCVVSTKECGCLRGGYGVRILHQVRLGLASRFFVFCVTFVSPYGEVCSTHQQFVLNGCTHSLVNVRG